MISESFSIILILLALEINVLEITSGIQLLVVGDVHAVLDILPRGRSLELSSDKSKGEEPREGVGEPNVGSSNLLGLPVQPSSYRISIEPVVRLSRIPLLIGHDKALEIVIPSKKCLSLSKPRSEIFPRLL